MENESDEKLSTELASTAKLFLELSPIIHNAIKKQFEKDGIEPLCIKHLSPLPVWNEQEPSEYIEYCLDNNYLLRSSGMSENFDFQDLITLAPLLEALVSKTYSFVKTNESPDGMQLCGSTYCFRTVQLEESNSQLCVTITFLLSGRVRKPEEWWASPVPS
jgi:hypothetical protein